MRTESTPRSRPGKPALSTSLETAIPSRTMALSSRTPVPDSLWWTCARSTDSPLEHIEVSGPAYSGIAIRTYPYCKAEFARGSFTQRNT